MYNETMLIEAVQLQVESNQKTMDRILKNAKAIRKIEQEAGISLIDSKYALYYGESIHIDRKDLPKIRKVVGRLRVDSKDVAGDYEVSKQIAVFVVPKNEEFSSLRFTYRTPHRGTRCRVETSVYKQISLVCDT